MNDPLGFHSEAYPNYYSEEQNQEFSQQFSAITQQFSAQMTLGTPVASDAVQDLVRQHYEFCSQFWTPTRDAYKGLALSYLVPSPYRDSYESVAVGLAQYHYDAMVIWADQNL